MSRVHKCDEAIEQVYYFLDGEMTWFKSIRIRRHLRRCGNCHSAFEFETRFKEVLRRKCVEPPPPELIDRLRTFLTEHKEQDPA